MASCPPSFAVQCSGRVVHSPTSLSSLTLSPLQRDCHLCQARSSCCSIQLCFFQLLSTLNSCHTWQSWISPGQHSPGFASISVYSITMHLCMLSQFSRVRLFATLRSPPGSSVLGILQTRILEWVAMPSSRGPSRPRNQTCVSLSLTLQVGSWPWGFPGGSLVKNPPAIWEAWVQSLGWKDPLEKGKATHSMESSLHGLYSPWGHKESDTTKRLSLFSHLCHWEAHHCNSGELLFLHLHLQGKRFSRVLLYSFICSLKVTLSPSESSTLTTYHLPVTDSPDEQSPAESWSKL